ncbi:MAG TPA: FAD/NAD(P)-binding protein [Caulobacteraceae bacterium]|jgi:uncharacterized NAD(P)/FAD-binding protein YdhS
MQAGPVIAVVGAGFSGTLTALRLLHAGPPGAHIFLIEKTPGFGRGLAYATHNPIHLLNVRVGNMSAFAEDPGHLRRWLAAGAGGQGDAAFISRGTYGDYLAALIQAAIAQPDGAERLVLVPDQATDLGLTAEGAAVRLAMGRVLEADAVVLAPGNLPPLSPSGVGLQALPPPLYAPDPWAEGALTGLDPGAEVLLLGSGLTMVDVALDLQARGHQGGIAALSRRGLAPHRHEEVGPFACEPPHLQAMPLSWRLRERRRRAAEVGWRATVDELRPVTVALWRAASDAQKKRFLRHLRPWWDIHRHRTAPAVAAQVDALRAAGRLTVSAGRLVEVSAQGATAIARWRPRGTDKTLTLRVARIVNCTGAGGDLARTTDPLLRRLIQKGAIRADPLGLGLEVNAAAQVIGVSGRISPNLYAAGPITQGYAWEAVAVPDIRNQVARLVQALAERSWKRSR